MVNYIETIKVNDPFVRPWMSNNCVASSHSKHAVLKHVLAGGLAGATDAVISYPAEYIKTQLQLDGKSGKAKKYDGFFDVIRKTIQKDGFFGLYRGLGVLIVFAVPKVGVRFSVFEALKEQVQDEHGNLSNTMKVMCGLGAGVAEAIFAVTPMETIKVKFIHDQRSNNPKYKGLIKGTSKIIQEEGISGIYRGLLTTVMRQGSNQAIRFYIMESLRDLYRAGDQSVRIPTPVTGFFGLIAAAVSVFANTPVDVIKTRMQGLEAARYKNSLDCARQVWTQEGPLAFYKGVQPRLVMVCLHVCFTFMLYDSIVEIMDRLFD